MEDLLKIRQEHEKAQEKQRQVSKEERRKKDKKRRAEREIMRKHRKKVDGVVDKIVGKAFDATKHWGQKALDAMTTRDWRILREVSR